MVTRIPFDFNPALPTTLLTTQYEYINVNKDPELRKKMVKYFLKKIDKWKKTDKNWKSVKVNTSSKPFIKKLYKLLRKFVKSSDAEWYDLIDNRSVLKDYLRYRLGKK